MKSIFQILVAALLIYAGNGHAQSGEKQVKQEVRIEVENKNPDKTYHVKVVTEKDGKKKINEKTFESLEEMESDSTISLHVSGDQDKIFNIQVKKLPDDFEWTESTDSPRHRVIIKEGGNFVFINKEEDEPSIKFFSEADSGKNIQSYEIRIVKEGDATKEGEKIKKEVLLLKDDEGHITLHPGRETGERIRIENEPHESYQFNDPTYSAKEASIVDISSSDKDFYDFNIANMPSLTLKTLKYYPNPNQGEFTLTFSGSKKPVILRILNQKGNLMYEENLKDFSGYFNEVINVKRFEKGKYLLQIHQQGKVLNKKLVIE